MGAKKPSLERVDSKTSEQKNAINSLLQAIGGVSPDILGQLGQQGVGNQDIYNQALSQLSQQIGQGFNPEMVQGAYEANVANPARQNLQEQILPQLQERLGRSSAFGNYATRAVGDLEKNLAGGLQNELLGQQRFQTQAQQGALGQALGYAQAPQQSQLQDLNALLASLGLGTGTDLFAYNKVDGKQGFGDLIGAGLGAAGGFMVGGPAGAQAGAQLGGTIGGRL